MEVVSKKMSKQKINKIIYLALIIIWMLTVYMFSNENGNESQNTSRSVTKTIVKIITYNQNLTEEQELTLIENTDYVVRKLAHFSIYLLGGILIYNYINTFNLKGNKKIIISVIIGVLYATFDEFHQYFVAGRSGRIIDVFIDSSGVITGITLIYLVKKINKKYLQGNFSSN